MKNTRENKRFFYFAFFHSGSKKSPFRTRLGPPKSSKIAPKTPPGAPKWPQDGVQTVPWTPKMAVQTSPEPSKPPSRPSKIQFWRSRDPPSPDFGRPGPILAPIWRSQASFWTPRDQFSSPQAPIFQPRLPFAPVLHASKSVQAFPNLSKPFQASRPPVLHACKAVQASKPPSWVRRNARSV